jgi:hypothetical protein
MEMVKNGEHLLARQDDGQSNGFLRALDSVQPRQLVAEDILVQTEKRALRLILCRCGDLVSDGKVGQETLDLGCAHGCRKSLAVEADEALNPVEVRLLGADAVVSKADPIAYLIEQARTPRR